MIRELDEILHSDNIESGEIHSVLGSFFERGSHEFFSNHIQYGDSNEPELTLVYGSNGRLRKIVAGPRFDRNKQTKLLNIIRDCLLNGQIPCVGRAVLLCGAPIKGHFRFGDDLQILPPPNDAPRVWENFSAAVHPMIIEFKMNKSQDNIVTATRRETILTRWQRVLHCLMNVPVLSKNNTHDLTWVTTRDSPNTSFLASSGYTYPENRGMLNRFSNNQNLTHIEREVEQEYYSPPGNYLRTSLHCLLQSN